MQKLIKWPIFLLAFLTPLVIDLSVFFPYITGKMMLVRSVMAFCWIAFAGVFIFVDDFRNNVVKRSKEIFKNPVFIGVLAFMFLMFVGIFFAPSSFKAFFGDVERAEGFLGISYFAGFFVLAALLFDKKDWIIFFRIIMASGVILFVDAIIEFAQGVSRPASYTGNPIYLATYFLFVMFAALVVAKEAFDKRSRIWLYPSILVFLMGLAGIFVTQTRGVIAGIFAGALVALAYFLFRGKNKVLVGNLTVKKLSLYIVGLLLVFVIIFIATRSMPLWSRFPGFDRLANFSLKDNTFETRFMSIGVSLNAINPVNNGIGRFLIGWGQDNFSVAYNSYYNPSYYKYEQQWFDRAHNKVLDVFVMEGLLGLLAYLGIWVGAAWIILKKKGSLWLGGSLVFFGVSYFVQNLFVFDSISTYIPFFSLLAFLVFYGNNKEENLEEKNNKLEKSDKKREWILGSAAGIIAIFFVVGLYYSALSYSQLRSYLSLIKSGDAKTIYEGVDSTFYPYSTAQEDIRPQFLSLVSPYLGQNQGATALFQKGIIAMEDYINHDTTNPRHLLELSRAYAYAGSVTGNKNYFSRAEELDKEAMKLAPKRQDIFYALAYTLTLEGKDQEAIDVAQKAIDIEPGVGDSYYYLGTVIASINPNNYQKALGLFEKAFTLPGFTNGNAPALGKAYEMFLPYFKNNKDKSNFITAAKRFEKLNASSTDLMDKNIGYAQNGQWNKINLNF